MANLTELRPGGYVAEDTRPFFNAGRTEPDPYSPAPFFNQDRMGSYDWLCSPQSAVGPAPYFERTGSPLPEEIKITTPLSVFSNKATPQKFSRKGSDILPSNKFTKQKKGLGEYEDITPLKMLQGSEFLPPEKFPLDLNRQIEDAIVGLTHGTAKGLSDTVGFPLQILEGVNRIAGRPIIPEDWLSMLPSSKETRQGLNQLAEKAAALPQFSSPEDQAAWDRSIERMRAGPVSSGGEWSSSLGEWTPLLGLAAMPIKTVQKIANALFKMQAIAP